MQGVGFRPFISKLARQHSLNGFVANTSQGVLIEVQGNGDSLDRFVLALREQAPLPAVLSAIVVTTLAPGKDTHFAIMPSDPRGSASTLVSPDLSTCKDCQKELFDPENRRYRYPFINCTHCGPRFTIITSIPYDRSATTMAPFSMCPACQAEYDDPDDRRFHAQPNACPVCGPQAQLYDNQGRVIADKDKIFSSAAGLLGQGAILAIKGLGGFHLAVDAKNEAAVQRLRQRKGRQDKPFALMAADLAMAHTLCQLAPRDETILTSCQRPILLAPRLDSALISKGVAPYSQELGLMLPYTPLHHLIFEAYRNPLVLTSGNRSGEPLCISNEEALSQLNDISDAFLIHNRDIICRADDSVVMTTRTNHPILRRSRGYAPAPLIIDSDGPQILAVGAELKNTICLLKGNFAFLSQHLGDLKNLSAASFFKEALDRLITLFAGNPELVVHDLHPRYMSSQWAREENTLPTLAVQHHHAHLAACLAENHHQGPAIGVILDGSGYGPDNTIWGGEILIGGCYEYTRYAFLEPMPLPGGDVAVREPWRTAVGYLVKMFGDTIPALDFLSEHNWQPVAEIARNGIYSPLTSSCGRLFDAVAAMSGGRQTIFFEGQAAIEMMHAASQISGRCYEINLHKTQDGYMMMVTPMLKQIVYDLLNGAKLSLISSIFHHTLIELLTQTVQQASEHYGIRTVALSGGVFANRLILDGLHGRLTDNGLTVLSHTLTPPGDGCIALGQAIIGRHRHNTIF